MPAAINPEAIRRRLERHWGPRPVGPLEVLLTAGLLGWLFVTSFRMPTFGSEPNPTGLARLLPGDNFTWLHQPGVHEVCLWIIAVAAVLLVLNRLLWLALPIIAFLHLALGTLVSSQSEEPGHKYQLVALVALTLWAWDWFSRARNWRRRPELGLQLLAPNPLSWWATAAWLVIQVIVASYLVSVLSKIILSEGQWFQRTTNYAVQFLKTDFAEYYNTLKGPKPGELRLIPGPDASWLERASLDFRRWIFETPYAGPVLLSLGFFAEAASFLALRGRIPALLCGLALLGLHLGIQVVMQLDFEVHMALLIIYFIALPHWLDRLLKNTRLRLPSGYAPPTA